MTALIIRPKALDYVSREDFGAEVSDTELLVPGLLAQALERLRVHTADEFVSYTYAAPSVIASELGWKAEDVMQAMPGLVGKLRGRVADHILYPRTRQRVYGALPSRHRTAVAEKIDFSDI